MKYSHLFHGETNHNRPQSRSIVDVPLRPLETSQVSLGSQIDGSFYPQKNVGRRWHPSKICGIPGIPKIRNQGCRTPTEFPYLTFGLRRASSELPLTLADIPWQGVRKLVSQKENPAKIQQKHVVCSSVWVYFQFELMTSFE